MSITTIPAALAPVMKSRYLHRPRALFVLKRRPDVSPKAFEQALRDWKQQKKFGAGIIVQAGAAMVEDQEIISGFFRAGGIEAMVIDGYVSLDVANFDPTPADFDTLFKAAEGCLDTLMGVIVPAESIAFAGISNLAIPGVAPISMIMILDRATGLTIERYNEWWIPHGDDHRRVNPTQIGYHQLHIAPEFNAVAAKAAGVSTTDRCIIDHMYLARLKDAFFEGNPLDYFPDMLDFVSMATVSSSFMREL